MVSAELCTHFYSSLGFYSLSAVYMYEQTVMWRMKEGALVLHYIISSCSAVQPELYTVVFRSLWTATNSGC